MSLSYLANPMFNGPHSWYLLESLKGDILRRIDQSRTLVLHLEILARQGCCNGPLNTHSMAVPWREAVDRHCDP